MIRLRYDQDSQDSIDAILQRSDIGSFFMTTKIGFGELVV